MSAVTSLADWQDRLIAPDMPDEYEVKTLLKGYGLSVPEGVRIDQHDDSTKIECVSPPYVVKVCSGDILHKTELKGVRVGVEDESIESELADMFKRFPGSRVLVEEMLPFDGPEFIVGGMNDPNYGPAVMAGAGGVLAELYSDVVFRLVPLSVGEAARMLEELAISPVLHGYRGSTLAKNGLSQLITTTAEIIGALGSRFIQMDLNPVVFSSGKWTVLDGKIRLGNT